MSKTLLVSTISTTMSYVCTCRSYRPLLRYFQVRYEVVQVKVLNLEIQHRKEC